MYFATPAVVAFLPLNVQYWQFDMRISSTGIRWPVYNLLYVGKRNLPCVSSLSGGIPFALGDQAGSKMLKPEDT